MNKEINAMKDIKNLGQVYTPDFIVDVMLNLKINHGTILEPSAGDGAFGKKFDKIDAIEIDKNCPFKCIAHDFFDFSTDFKYDTIIGNPPFVRFQDILPTTKHKLPMNLFDERSNLFLFFIYKSIQHLNPNGELIFITPRDFLKLTSAKNLNDYIFKNGTITHYIECGDNKIFDGATPNCAIWRFEKNNYHRKTKYKHLFDEHWQDKNFYYTAGQLLFLQNNYSLKLSDIVQVKVGAVSGDDAIFGNDDYGNCDFVCSFTHKTGNTRKMIYGIEHLYLSQFKDRLMARKIKKFNENNWWHWGRGFYVSNKPRIYVNSKTRQKNPFFIHECQCYDGSVLALFPIDAAINIKELTNCLNNLDWNELGFTCDGRFLFTQRTLENCPLPEKFNQFKN